jgi:hypothetical protein
MNGVVTSNNCNPSSVESWIDYQRTGPFDPRDLIARATINSAVGEFAFSSDFIEPGVWSVSPLAITNKPNITALESDNQLKVADADQWNFQHLTWNDSSALALPLRKVVFLRGVHEWNNRLYIDFGATPITEVQISFLMNAATRGDKQGTVAVIKWTGLNLTGENTLNVVLRQIGTFSIGIWTFDGADHAMFETTWNVVR